MRISENKWIAFKDEKPEYDQFIAAININEQGWTAIGHWRNGEVWQNGNDLNGFSHLCPLAELRREG